MLPFCIKPKIGQNAEKLSFSYKTLIFENLFLNTYFVLLCLSCQGSVPELQRQLFSQFIPDEWMIMWSVVYTSSGGKFKALVRLKSDKVWSVYVPVSHVALLTALCVQTWAGKGGVDSFSAWWPRFLEAAGTKSEWLFTNAP